MAHSVLSKDMVNLVQAMKQAQRFAQTTLDGEYRKHMLSAAHIIAVNAKNLLDTVATVRTRVQSGLGPEDPLPVKTVAPAEMSSVVVSEEHLNKSLESSYYNVQSEVVKETADPLQNAGDFKAGAFVT